jgi:hypothetical protein
MAFGRWLLALVLIVLLGGSPAQATARAPADTSAFLGTWLGTLEADGSSFRVVFTVQQAGQQLSGTMDSPDQGVTDIPIPQVLISSDTLRMGVPSIAGQFAGVLDTADAQITGRWIQGDRSFPLTLDRTDAAPTVQRPQEPVPPFPYQTETVRFATSTAASGGASLMLEGTLTRPSTDADAPAAVLVAGTGPHDRDGARHGHKPFLVLADHLTRQGIAVFRFDERGVGSSEGTQRGATFGDFATDVQAAVQMLRAQPGIDASAVGLVGYSEGGVIAPIAATRTENLAFLALLSAPGLPGDSILARQLDRRNRQRGLDRRTRALQRGTQQRIFEVLKQDADSAAIASDLRRIMIEASGISGERIIEREIRRLMQPWLRFYISHSPRATLRAVEVPVLALYGANDRQIDPAAHRQAVEKALAAGASPPHTVQIFENLNHRLQPSATGGMSEYGRIPETFAPEVLTTLSDWIRAQTLAEANE